MFLAATERYKYYLNISRRWTSPIRPLRTLIWPRNILDRTKLTTERIRSKLNNLISHLINIKQRGNISLPLEEPQGVADHPPKDSPLPCSLSLPPFGRRLLRAPRSFPRFGRQRRGNTLGGDGNGGAGQEVWRYGESLGEVAHKGEEGRLLG